MSDTLEHVVREGPARAGDLGRDARFHATCDSTNDEALELAAAGAPHGTLVVADAQTAGRGRRGRRWHSPPGVALYASLVLRPASAPDAPTRVVAAMGLGLAEGLEQVAGVSIGIKWPNDLWCAGRKLAGVLVEARGYDPHRPVLVAGFGVNVNQTEAGFPEDLAGRSTSLALHTGHDHDRGAILALLLAALEPRLGQAFAPGPAADLQHAYRDRSILLGRRVTLRDGNEPVSGVVADLSATDGLLLRSDDGRHLHIRAEHARDVRLEVRRDSPRRR